MATIPPQLPNIGSTGKLAHSSPLKQGPPQPHLSFQPPGDDVHISAAPTPPPQEAPAPARSGNWLKRMGWATLGLSLLAGGAMIGGAFSPALSADSIQAQTAQVQTHSGKKAVPATLQHEAGAQQLEFQTVRFNVTPTTRSFGNAPVKLAADDTTESKDGPGGALTHKIKIDRLEGKDGKVLYNNDEAEMQRLNFQDQAEGNWETTVTLKPAGHFGKYVSVAETYSSYAGGASGGNEVRLRTIDSQTGKVVNLSDIVSGEDYGKIAKQITDGVNGSLQGINYRPDPSTPMESLDAVMNNGFSLHQDKEGGVLLTVALPNQQDSQGGKVAEFTFKLPASAIAH